MSSNQALTDSLTSRQIFIERYSKGEAKRLFKHLEKLAARLKTMVKNDYERIKAVKLAQQVSVLTNIIIKEYGEDLIKGLSEFAQEEAEFASQAIKAATSASVVNPASFNQIQAVLTKKKMELISGKIVQKLTVNQAIKSFTAKKTSEITQLIRDGATTGKTSQELVSDISNLIKTRTKSQASSLVRTTTNHMGAQARQATYKENDDVVTGEEYVATLDSHTTVECSSLDGNIYPIGEGAIPPIHWSCRSVRVPVINPEYDLGSEVTGTRASQDGEVSAQSTYGGWLKKQNKATQIEVLGAERTKLFRAGKLSIGKFTDDRGRVYTLAELKKLNPIAFN